MQLKVFDQTLVELRKGLAKGHVFKLIRDLEKVTAYTSGTSDVIGNLKS